MLYLFYGADEFTRSEALADLRERIPLDLRDLNSTSLEGRKLKLDDLARACEALPFLADLRVVAVYDALKHFKAGKEREALRDYLPQVPPACHLVFVEQGDVDKRSSLFTYLKKHGELREFRPREGDDLLRWLVERARLLDTSLDRRTAKQLVEYAGNDSRTLINELTKLATFAGRGQPVTIAMVEQLVQDTQEHSLFAFIDDLSRRSTGDALRGLRGLLADGQATAYILFMLIRQARILLGVQELAAERRRPDDIAAQIGQKPFVVRKALEQVRGFTREELETLHDRLVETDWAIKTGRARAEVALELLVMDVCRTRR